MNKKNIKQPNVRIKNKRATFDYELVESFTAGIVLSGSEIKSIRAGKASLVDTYCIITDGEVWVKNMYIAEYEFTSYNGTPTRRDRKLLLNKKEIYALASGQKNPGFTIIPTLLFINEKGRAKLNISIARGNKEYDKRQAIREKDDKREMDRARKNFK